MSKQQYNLSVPPGSTKNNKTGGWRTYRPVFDHDKCIGCGNCERVCPEGVCFFVDDATREKGRGSKNLSLSSSPKKISKKSTCHSERSEESQGLAHLRRDSSPLAQNDTFKEGGRKGYYECDLDYCKGCGICAKECPAGAIKMEREEK